MYQAERDVVAAGTRRFRDAVVFDGAPISSIGLEEVQRNIEARLAELVDDNPLDDDKSPRSDPSTWPRDFVLCDGVPIEGIDIEDVLRNLDLPAVDQ